MKLYTFVFLREHDQDIKIIYAKGNDPVEADRQARAKLEEDTDYSTVACFAGQHTNQV